MEPQSCGELTNVASTAIYAQAKARDAGRGDIGSISIGVCAHAGMCSCKEHGRCCKHLLGTCGHGRAAGVSRRQLSSCSPSPLPQPTVDTCCMPLSTAMVCSTWDLCTEHGAQRMLRHSNEHLTPVSQRAGGNARKAQNLCVP